MRKALLTIIVIILLVPAALVTMQDTRAPRLEITGLNPQDLPTITVTVNVFDNLGQPVPNLTAADFGVVGELADRARIVSVTDTSSADIPISVVLAIDVSSSMAGTPIESASLAATAFVEAINDNDPVAIITFSSGVQVNQDFTTDRDTLNAIINSLGFGGQTFLYDAALSAVNKASETDNPRRAVILLSDGAQYDTGPFSNIARDEAIQAAVISGVPVYTIGLGFGIDRTYLEELSGNTNALFRESPTPDELDAIFAELASLLRTQYEVVIEVDVPQDGQVYDLDLEVITDQGSATATGRLRAPVPVPVVTLPEITDPIAELTEVTAEIVADDDVDSVEVQLDGTSQVIFSEEPYLYVIDPVSITPGAHTLTFTATDVDGDSGSSTLEFTVAALPSQVRFNPPLGGEFAQAQVVTIDISGQTPPVNVTVSQDDGEPQTLTAPFSFTIDPLTIAPGDHTLIVEVENAGGASTSVDGTFGIPDIPPQFSITGLEPGQMVNGIIDVGVMVETSQSPIADIAYEVNGDALSSSAGTAQINATVLEPGAATLNVTVTTELGQSAINSINFTVTALPPSFTVSGLQPGETLDADRTVIVEDVESQTAIISINAQVDGQLVAVSDSNEIVLEVVPLSAGDHILSVTVTNAGGQAANVDVPFIVTGGLQETATALALPTDTETPTDEPTATNTESVNETATTAAESTAAQQAADVAATAAQVGVTETADVVNNLIAQTATSSAQSIIDEQATSDAAAQLAITETADVVNSMMDQTATADVQSALDQQATADAAAQLAITETADVVANMMQQTATADAQNALDEQATADAAAQLAITETADVVANMMQQTVDAQSALDEQATSDAAAQLAITETADVVANMMQQTATADAQSALDEQATSDAAAQLAITETADVVANMMQQTATADAQSELTQAAEIAQSTADAQATLDAEAAQATVDAQNTLDAQAALDRATESAEATVNAQATLDAEPTASDTSEPTVTETLTDVPTEVEPTDAGTEAAQVSTEVDATPTSADESGTPVPTITPIGTLIPAQAETAPSNNNLIPIVVIVVIVIIILLLAFFILNRGRRQRS